MDRSLNRKQYYVIGIEIVIWYKRITCLRVYAVAGFNMKTGLPKPVTDEGLVRDAKRDLSPPDLP